MRDEPTIIEQILFLEMEPGDRGWSEGYRYMVQTPEGDEFFFADRDRTEDFIIREGLAVIMIPQMFELRKQRFPEIYTDE